ncbi:MAG: prepilin-type N-terminal cleavage/methylation domain-containing protein [Candidatus Aminicenantes bacterium]
MNVKPNCRRGFTLIEMIIVFTLIGILVGLGLPQFQNAAKRAREAVLKENLFLMRKLINQYYLDKKKYPADLQALVDDGYLKMIPEDPITGSSETWVEVPQDLTDDEIMANVIPGVMDVQSGSDEISLDGTPYSSW